ncbi:MAG: hypothetical protein Q8P22_13405 [Chloroflexota bacterium]|nr:hypothetical protein [Chloroflexota bacterium]
MRKTRLMEEVEQRYGGPLEQVLPDLLNKRGLTGTARVLQVSNQSVEYWILKLGITWKAVVLNPGDVATISGPRGIRVLEG